MARNDGIDRTSARNVDVPDKDIDNTQKHNEREKDSYSKKFREEHEEEILLHQAAKNAFL